MTKKNIIPALCLVALPLAAQNTKQSFQDFRNEILGNYKEFRQTLLDNYADFLNGEWHEYQSLNGEKRYKTPKPETPPTATPTSGPTPQPQPHPTPVVEPQPATAPAPAPISPAPASDVTTEGLFLFYTIPVSLPQIEFNILQRLELTSDYGRQWKMLADSGVADRVVPGLKKKVREMGLNDYLTYQFVKAYVESLFPRKDDSSRFSAMHYLLANMGYDVRIAVTTDGLPLLLIPFDRMVYGRTYMMLDGKKYYVFAPDSFDIENLGSKRILTCKIPTKVDKGKDFGLIVGELNIPYDPYPFELKSGRITLAGEMNRNLIPILYHYPQMGVDGFAQSNIQPGLRKELVRQLKAQLAGMPEEEAVNTLLQFTQSAFQYATDEDFHGFEKPYFLEETLYYPKNDCEDRAIFYTYFLWYSIGKEAQLISFPGHESAAVKIDTPIEGAKYECDGTTYYISDPTYIGSTTGMVMPRYKNEKPTVDYTYKSR